MMWLGEQITEKGVGNGISIILLINIVARIPNDLSNLYQNYVAKPTDVTSKIIAAVIILAIIVAMFVFIVFLQDGERRFPVQYAKKIQGHKVSGGQSSHIPLKVNTAGGIPGIFDVSSGCYCKFCGYSAKDWSGRNILPEVPYTLQSE